MSRLLYASPAQWGLTTTKDKLTLERKQRKLIKMDYLPDKETTFEKKLQTAEENLFNKMIFNEEHVLCQFLPPKKEDNVVCVPKLIASSSLLKMTLILSPEFFTVHLTKRKYYVDIVTQLRVQVNKLL